MTEEFKTALQELASLSGEVGRALIVRFSGAGPDDIALFREGFPRVSDAVRRAALASMVECAETDFELDFRGLYRVALDDVLPEVRRLAIEGLWEDERLDLMRRLITLLESDPSDMVRAAAATSLGRYIYMAECDDLDRARGDCVREALERAHASQSLEVSRRALESLAFISEEPITRLIDAAYAHSDPLMRQSALFAMGRSADRFWSETVLAELHSDEAAMRYEAARASGEMRLTRALPVLARLILGDRDVEVQAMAVWAMGEIGGKRARQLLERLVEGEDEALSLAAQEALDGLGFANPDFDMFIFEAEDEESVLQGHPGHTHDELDVEDADDEPDAEDDGVLTEYRRLFERYMDEDDDSDDADEGDWLDDFIEQD